MTTLTRRLIDRVNTRERKILTIESSSMMAAPSIG